MKTFRNANFTTRNYECTNIVCCQSATIEEARAVSPNANWIECAETEIASRKMSQLWIQGGVRLFGWL
jgi:hypothetical protein